MKSSRFLASLTLLNLGILITMLFHHSTPVEADSALQVVRARGLEIVDAQGKLRASLTIIPAGPARGPDGRPTETNGKVYPEAVVFRLIRPDGRPSVKIATTEQGSGIDLSGGLDPTYIVLNSDEQETSMTLINRDGRRQTIKP